MKYLFAFVFFFSALLSGEEIVTISAVPQKINEELWVALKFEVKKEGWHTYWVNPGEMEIPAEVNWELPQDVRLGESRWSTPEIFLTGGLVTFGSEDTLWLFQKLEGAKTPIEGRVSVTWFACKDECTFGNSLVAFNTEQAEIRNFDFAKAFELLPKREEVTQDPSSLAYFFPYQKGAVLEKEAKPLSEWNLEGKEGVLVVYGNDGIKAFELSGLINQESLSFLMLILFAFGGGVLLNLMPCIFPVLSIKALSLIKLTQGSRVQAVWHSLVTMLGILITFWVLALILIISKGFGQALGWGFQFQNAYFVGFFCILLFLAGISLFGFFEIGVFLLPSISTKKENRASFLASLTNGIVTALISTPCTGPFLGPVLGVSLTLDNFQALTVFTFLGVGLAFPFLLVTWVPPLQRLLPRPGAWMEKFKWWMGFLLIATVFWLTSLFFDLAGTAAGIALVAFYLITGGYFAFKSQTKKQLFKTSMWIALLLVVFLAFSKIDSENEGNKGLPYNQEKLESLINRNQPVFVNFTAKWCLTCQFNKLAIHDNEVEKEMEKLGVTYFVADWTEQDDEITKALNAFGRNSVPFYLLYAPGEKEPVILPQILTKDILLSALRDIEKNVH